MLENGTPGSVRGRFGQLAVLPRWLGGIVDESQVVASINKARKGIAQYLEIMELLPYVDVSRDRNFQRKYNAFYRVRQRPKEWYELYFAYLEGGKADPPSFENPSEED